MPLNKRTSSLRTIKSTKTATPDECVDQEPSYMLHQEGRGQDTNTNNKLIITVTELRSTHSSLSRHALGTHTSHTHKPNSLPYHSTYLPPIIPPQTTTPTPRHQPSYSRPPRQTTHNNKHTNMPLNKRTSLLRTIISTPTATADDCVHQVSSHILLLQGRG